MSEQADTSEAKTEEPAMPAAPALAEQIVTEVRYVVLATSDADGLPWASPVYFAHRALDEFYWISAADSTHSHNISQRPDVSLVVFDSQQAVGTGRAVYARAHAELVPDDGFDAALDVYSRRSSADGAGGWDAERLRASGFHLYRARTSDVSLLPGVGSDRRLPVQRTAMSTAHSPSDDV